MNNNNNEKQNCFYMFVNVKRNLYKGNSASSLMIAIWLFFVTGGGGCKSPFLGDESPAIPAGRKG